MRSIHFLLLLILTVPMSAQVTRSIIGGYTHFQLLHAQDTIDFVVRTSGGHNAGIVSEPGRTDRHYRIASKRETDRYVDPDSWYANTPASTGSWWPQWVQWLLRHSGKPAAPPDMGAPEKGLRILLAAPGSYVLER